MAAPPIEIESLDDPRVAMFRDVRDKDLRGRDGFFMAESELVLRRLARQPERLHAVLVSPARCRQLEAVLARLPDRVQVFVAGVDLLTGIAGFHVHRGVLAVGRRPDSSALTLDAALGHLRGRSHLLLLVAEGLTNVDNMGGLFRNAAAFGVDGIVLDPTCCDPLYRKAIRVSMGHVLGVPWAVASNWPEDLDRLHHEWGATLVAAESMPGALPLSRVPGDPRLAVLLGSEGHGLSGPALERCCAIVEIPMAGDVPSLNVAVAAGVVLYELTRTP